MSFHSLISSPPNDFDDMLAESGIDGILIDALEQIATTRPKDPLSFLIGFLQEQQDANTPQMEEDISLVPKTKGGRRMALSYGETNTEEELQNMDIKPVPKDEETTEKLNNALSCNVLCSHLDVPERREIFAHMKEVHFEAGKFVITQGEDGDHFYVVDEGELEVFVNSKDGSRKMVQHITPGGSFGELALITNNPRAADVVAITDVKAWVIDRSTYRRVIMKYTIDKRKRYEESLDSVPILSTLEKYERLVVADALESVTFKEGSTIVKQGESGDVFFIILEGTAKVTKTEGEAETHLGNLSTCNYFGEIALLTDKPRAATVTATSDMICAKLDRARFTRVLGPCEDILRRNISHYAKYMTDSEA